MTHTALTVPPEVLEESGIDLGASLHVTAEDGKITLEQLGARRCVACPYREDCEVFA